MPKGTVAPEKIYATLPSTKRGERVYLTGDPKGKYFGYGRTKHLVMRDIEVSLSLSLFFRFSPTSLFPLFIFLKEDNKPPWNGVVLQCAWSTHIFGC